MSTEADETQPLVPVPADRVQEVGAVPNAQDEAIVDLDEAFEIVGPYGRFQWAAIFICALGWAFSAESLLITPFITKPPNWRYVGGNGSIYSSGRGCMYDETKAWEWVEPRYSLKSTLPVLSKIPCSAGELEATSASTSFFLGMLFGAPIISCAADRYGRKWVHIIGSLVLSVAFGCSASAQTFAAYSVWRFVNGFAQAGVSNLCFMYPTELVGKAFRGQVALFTSLGWVVGCIGMSVAAYLVPDWRMLTLVSAAPSFVFTLVTLPCLVESPAYLVAQQRAEEAQNALLAIARQNGILDVEDRIRGLAWGNLQASASKRDSASQETCGTLMRQLPRRLVILSLIYMGCALGYNGISLGVGDLGNDIYTTSVLSAVVEVPAYVFCSWIVSIPFLGRKWSAFWTSALTVCACVMASQLTGHSRTLVALLGKFAVAAAYIIIILYTAELFPASVRSSAIGIVSTASRISTLFAPVILTLPAPMLIFGIVSAISVPGIALLPETMGQSIPTTLKDHSGCDVLSFAECFGHVQFKEAPQNPAAKGAEVRISPSHHKYA